MNNRHGRAAAGTDVRGRVCTLPRGVFWIFYGGRVMKFLKNTGRQKILLEYLYIIAVIGLLRFPGEALGFRQETDLRAGLWLLEYRRRAVGIQRDLGFLEFRCMFSGFLQRRYSGI